MPVRPCACPCSTAKYPLIQINPHVGKIFLRNWILLVRPRKKYTDDVLHEGVYKIHIFIISTPRNSTIEAIERAHTCLILRIGNSTCGCKLSTYYMYLALCITNISSGLLFMVYEYGKYTRIWFARRGIVRHSYAKLLSRFKGKSTKNKGR